MSACYLVKASICLVTSLSKKLYKILININLMEILLEVYILSSLLFKKLFKTLQSGYRKCF